MQITHAFINPIPDDPAFLGTKPSHWNSNHVVSDIVNADISATAAIDESKLNLNFPTFDASLYLPLTSLPLSPANGGTGIVNSGTLTLPAFPIAIAGGVTGGTYTLPATSQTLAGLAVTGQTFTTAQKINVNSTTAFFVEQDGVKDNVFVVDTALGYVGINRVPLLALDIVGGASGHAFRVRAADGYGFVMRNPADTQDLMAFAGGSTSGALKLYYNGTLVSQISSYPDQLYFCINTTNFAIGVTAGLEKLHVVKTTTTTNAVLTAQRIEARVSTAATGGTTGFGVGQTFYAETATDGTYQQQAQIAALWTDSTNATRKAKLRLSSYDTAQRIGLEIEASGTAVKLGFFGGTTAVQQVLAAYTSDGEGAAYTGIDNLQVGTVYATVADLNQLRVAYETLRASYDDLRTKLQTSTLVA